MRYCGKGQESCLPLWITFLCRLQVSNVCGTIQTYGAGLGGEVTKSSQFHSEGNIMRLRCEIL